MNLFTHLNNQVEVLGFQTFTNLNIATGYGVSENTIRSHKRLHADEIIEGLHFTTKTNKFGTDETLWTLRGIIKLGMFIRSPQAKNFRLWAEQELEKSILKELASAKEARERNVALAEKIANLQAIQKSQAKHNNNVINGYKSGVAKQRAIIKSQRQEYERLKDAYDTVLEEYMHPTGYADFDAFNQLMQRGMYTILEDTKRQMYQLSTELTLKFDKIQRR